MIKVENCKVFGWEAAVRGMRNPMNSWGKSDSHYDCDGNFVIGENDLKLAKSLVKAGSDHRKFLRFIVLSFDVTAPLYWWKEMETYRVGVAENPSDIEFNSCSTMHKIHSKEFVPDDFSHDKMTADGYSILLMVIEHLNRDRQSYLETKDKDYWYDMIQTLPASYEQMRTVQLNYEALTNMYHARKTHKLDEWVELCKWFETLPNFKQICLEE